MSFLFSLFRDKPESSESRASMNDAIQKFLTGDDTYPINTAAGATITEKTALSIAAVYACVRIIAWTLASLPLPVYRRLKPRGKERAIGSPLYKLLHDAPNPELTSFQWRSLTSSHQLLWGAGISEIEYDRSGVPVALWPIPPWKVTPKRSPAGSIFYEIDLDNGGKRPLAAYQALVFPSLSVSSYEWMSPISLHRESLGLSAALQDFGARTFGQGTNPAGIVTHPGKISEQSEKSLREALKRYEGLSNSHRLMLLEQGMKFERVGLPPEDAQFLESRKFSIAEIARIYNVPLHLLQDHEKSTSWGSGIEEMNLGFVTFTLRPYLVQWEQEIKRRLFDGNDDFYAEFLVEGLLRGKQSERYEAYTKGRQWGWLSINDIREIENMNPIEDGGDVYLSPLNMISAQYAGDKPAAPAPAGNTGGEKDEK